MGWVITYLFVGVVGSIIMLGWCGYRASLRSDKENQFLLIWYSCFCWWLWGPWLCGFAIWSTGLSASRQRRRGAKRPGDPFLGGRP